MKKRWLTAFVALILVFSLAGCGKTASDIVEEKISAIGAVSRDREEAIREAREAYLALPDEEKAKVNNLNLLEKAEEEFDIIVAGEADALIGEIEAWQPGSGNERRREQVQAAREAYDSLTENQQEKVTNLDKLLDAEKLPFAEEQGFIFITPGKTINVPVDARVEDDASIKPLINQTKILAPTVTRSEIGEDGYVEYTIHYKGEYEIVFDNNQLKGVRGHICPGFYTPEIYDYYTGLFLASSERVSSCPEDGLDVYQSTIEYAGYSFNIYLKSDEEGEQGYKSHYNSTYKGPTLSETPVKTYVMVCRYDMYQKIRVPAEYDGLIIAIRGEDAAVPAYEDMSNFDCQTKTMTVEAPAVHYWNGTPEQWVFIKVNDLLES